MKFQGFVGPSYKLDSVSVENQRCVNLYPELIESGTPKEGQVAYLRSTDGLEKLFEVGAGPIRCIEINSKGMALIISGDKCYQAYNFGAGWETLLATPDSLDTTSGIVVSATSDPGYETRTVFVDGINSYAQQQSVGGGSNGFKKFATLGFEPVRNATHVAFIDGYFVFNQKNTNVFLASEYSSLSVDPLSFASSEGDPDKIMGLIAVNRQLWIMNEKSTEVWATSGNADFPFERIQGGFIEKGCLARYSIAKAAGIVFWLDNNGSVQMAFGLSPKRVSTHAIEAAIASYADRTAATSFAYEKDGHVFYVINFAETSWCYDATTGMWHERVYTDDNGYLLRHRADVCGKTNAYQLEVVHVDAQNIPTYREYSNTQGQVLVGDYQNNCVYRLRSDVYEDNGQIITRLRSSPYVANGGQNIFHNSLELNLRVGVGLDGAAPIQDADPHIMMRFSDDSGRTWSNERLAGLGKIGEFLKRVIFRRLGKSRSRIYEVKYTGKTPFTILSADINLEQGRS